MIFFWCAVDLCNPHRNPFLVLSFSSRSSPCPHGWLAVGRQRLCPALGAFGCLCLPVLSLHRFDFSDSENKLRELEPGEHPASASRLTIVLFYLLTKFELWC